MKKQIVTLQLCVMAIAIVGTSVAQERDMSPPKVLVITREFVKPGKAGPSTRRPRVRLWPRKLRRSGRCITSRWTR